MYEDYEALWTDVYDDGYICSYEDEGIYCGCGYYDEGEW